MTGKKNATTQTHDEEFDTTTTQVKKMHWMYCKTLPLSTLESLGYKPLTDAEVEGVDKFIFFIGYPRSGHNFITGVLDSHPNIVIATEYVLTDKCRAAQNSGINLFRDKLNLFNDLYKTSFASSKCGWRSNAKTKKGYNLNIEGQWQGSFSQLRIIGDGAAGHTSSDIIHHKGMACIKKMVDTLDIAITGVHVVRNPYDMIATAMLYKLSSIRGEKVEQTKVQPNLDVQMQSAISIFEYASAVVQVKKTRNIDVLEIHIEDFIKDPKASVTRLCSVLDVPCPQDYIESCYKKSYKNVVRTRDRIDWNPDVMKYISQQMNKYSFFQGYSYQNDYYTTNN